MERPGADFTPLILALLTASSDPYASLDEQLASIELSFVEAELNPNPVDRVELFHSLRVLRELVIDRPNARAAEDLEHFFQSS